MFASFSKRNLLIMLGLVVLTIGMAIAYLPERSDAHNQKKGLECQLVSVSNGAAFNLSQLAGTRYVLQIFAHWCPHCVNAHPMIMSAKDDLPIYGIAFKDSPADVRHWLKGHGNPYKFVGVDSTGACLARLGVRYVPRTFIINEVGQVVYGAATSSLNKQTLIDAYKSTTSSTEVESDQEKLMVR